MVESARDGESMVEFIQVSTTVDRKNRADKIAKRILLERLASCVQVLGPITSSYWWKGRIELTQEWLCLIKARASDYSRIEDSIKKIHPYEVPEILASPILRGNEDYLDWIIRETTRKVRPVRKT